MAKQRKPTTGYRVARSIDPEGTMAAEVWRRRIARRIDRAIAAAVRKERERCAGVMNRPQLTMQQRTLAIKEGR
jgi:hypothetical protein